MKLHINDISSKVAKVDDRYVVKDNNTLNEL